ncbi:MAG: Protein YeeZ [Myxococcota bacterium]|nr:Protein YeeZ [Myxococcota bacterium]
MIPPSNTRRLLIAGCGYVGGALARQALQQGWRVTALSRGLPDVPPEAACLSADLTRPFDLPGAKPFEAAVYCAAAKNSSPEAYRAVYVEGLAHLLDALRSSGSAAARVIFTSSTSVYGQHQGEWVDESSPAEPEQSTGRILREAEEILLQRWSNRAILRLGGIYGPGRASLVESVRNGQAGRGPVRYTNRIHREDCAGACLHLLGLEHLQPVYNGVDHEPADRNEVLDWIAGRMGISLNPDTNCGERNGRGHKRVRNQRLIDSGYRFRYPTYREGYAGLIAALPNLRQAL